MSIRSLNDVSHWRQIPIWTAASVYWAISVFASRIQRLLGLGEGDGVWVIAATFFLIVIACMITQRTGWRLWKRIVYLPGSFLAHVVLTIPSSAALGVLMRTAGRERTVAEQRAVFLLASIPILVFSMRQSYLFIRTEKNRGIRGDL